MQASNEEIVHEIEEAVDRMLADIRANDPERYERALQLVAKDNGKETTGEVLDRMLADIKINDPERYERALQLLHKGNGNNGGERKGQGEN
jgi:pyruvate-formate lyase-activating enzyme